MAETEQPEEIAKETARGRSERTPWLALGSVHLVIAVLVAAVLVIAFLAYFLS